MSSGYVCVYIYFCDTKNECHASCASQYKLITLDCTEIKQCFSIGIAAVLHLLYFVFLIYVLAVWSSCFPSCESLIFHFCYCWVDYLERDHKFWMNIFFIACSAWSFSRVFSTILWRVGKSTLLVSKKVVPLNWLHLVYSSTIKKVCGIS